MEKQAIQTYSASACVQASKHQSLLDYKQKYKPQDTYNQCQQADPKKVNTWKNQTVVLHNANSTISGHLSISIAQKQCKLHGKIWQSWITDIKC